MSGEENKNLKSVVCAGIFTLALAGCQKEARANLAEIYFPLNVGNSWTYTNYPDEPNWGLGEPPNGGLGVELTFTIIGTEEIDGHTYYKFDRFFNPIPMPPNGEDMYWLARNVLLRYDSIADSVLSYCRFGSDRVEYDFTGNAWDPGTGIGVCQLKESNLVCNVPAGEFSDCIEFGLGESQSGLGNYIFGEYLAPSVGLIKFVSPGGGLSEGQEFTFVLQSYTIVPEPSMLLLLGLGGLLLRKRN